MVTPLRNNQVYWARILNGRDMGDKYTYVPSDKNPWEGISTLRWTPTRVPYLRKYIWVSHFNENEAQRHYLCEGVPLSYFVWSSSFWGSELSWWHGNSTFAHSPFWFGALSSALVRCGEKTKSVLRDSENTCRHNCIAIEYTWEDGQFM